MGACKEEMCKEDRLVSSRVFVFCRLFFFSLDFHVVLLSIIIYFLLKVFCFVHISVCYVFLSRAVDFDLSSSCFLYNVYALRLLLLLLC